jgi:hypothetical protein
MNIRWYGSWLCESVDTKGFDVKSNGRIDISQHFLVCITFTDDNAFEAQRIGNVPVGMLLNNDFQLSHHSDLLATGPRGERILSIESTIQH